MQDLLYPIPAPPPSPRGLRRPRQPRVVPALSKACTRRGGQPRSGRRGDERYYPRRVNAKAGY
ncbi:hypothetical protein [Streptomyces sp. Rer75]|uniref:hypothetical protein n=1 Tax=unclassified Streptomyces TaxID=2593676 RepID=UPI0015D03064|nr:hypothetical protein [Streptomyces sp. Rer75]QLH23177.1 hypothetical protein HYQ63_23235 [Streptomyces sp. Rer75]